MQSLPSPPLRRPRLQLLGQFRLEFHAEPVELCGNAQRLLAFLGLRGCVSRSTLAGTLWPDVPEERARGSLRTTLWRLPRDGEPLVRCTRDGIAVADAVSVDVHALTESALGVLHGSACGGSEPLRGPPAPLELLTGGDLLPGWDDDWVVPEREWLRQLRLHALEALSERLAGQGLPALALEVALASVRIEPLRESAHRAVVSAHLAEGNVIEAVRHYHAYRQLLREELGIEPSLDFSRMIPLTRR
ncbi:SARP family transcriptional regulator [Streptomyces sp. C10-9-1]|uniref:AfsR/SARP family transcriptional regulator n=1 Tax=Streptomyces sp. C10-9-1 TaxID=1859285 RepID=UPI002110FCC7|nr:BTAD domain-containing putative transcriptional regulator [Streptomyces sp. C10-9-1]MCQ6556836.1 SARP family transcriptional regulator [Streptomyces sp. C10-9-1]